MESHSAPIQVSLAAARAAIAACIIGDESAPLRIGDITLHAHQRSAIGRIRRTISDLGGALLCDNVGLGKTYVALALAAQHSSITIIAPAALADMWRRALAATRIDAEFISVESLGRGGPPARKRDLIVVDEAHNFRNSCTRRYAALARMCVLTPVLLLTATPLHNSRNDISAIAALFLGSRAYAMTDAELASIIVRRDATTARTGDQEMPVVEHMAPCVLARSDELLDMILTLPPPVPPSDGSVAARLVVHGLARQWASSNSALSGALRRRIARSHGLLASLDAGRYPTSAELSAWVYTGDAVQLAFAELLIPALAPLAELSSALRAHVSALTGLLSAAKRTDDDVLAAFVREIRATHPHDKLIAFSCYAETAEAVYRSLRSDGHVALLTGRGAMIASGPVSRDEILSQFAPRAAGVQHAGVQRGSEHAEVTLLVTTDILSEGVNLQDASIVIHLDLPWTPARMEQRIGRLARMGSPHPRVLSYSVNPAPRAEAFLRELEIMTRKSDRSARIFGDSPVSGVFEAAPERATVARAERIRAIVEKWRSAEVDTSHADGNPRVAVAHSTRDATQCGALGVWIVDGAPTLLAWHDGLGGTSVEASAVERAVLIAASAKDGARDSIDIAQLSRVFQDTNTWYDQHCAWLAVSGGDAAACGPGSRNVRRSLARVADAATTRSGFARRSQSAAIATRLRTAASTPLPLAVEWSLESLSECADEAAVNTILDLVDRARPAAGHVREHGIRCVAIILFVPPRGPGTMR